MEGAHIISTDEMTSIQALKHKYPDKPPLLGQYAKEAPYLNPTRTEEDFVKSVEALVSTAPETFRTFVCDRLNTPKLESLVGSFRKPAGLMQNWDKRGKCGILKSMESRTDFLHNPHYWIRFVYTPKYSSWMNQIEIWFGIVNRKLLKRKSYLSREELEKSIL